MKRVATTAIPYTEMEVATGNYDTSRVTIDRVVIHTMVGTAAAAAARFDNPSQQVSAHYGVKLDGSLIHWLEEYNTAYHAGNYAMNQRSIGIEHEDNGDYNGTRTDALYATSAKLVADICKFYNIPIDRQHIIKHSEVIATGCPDALDVDRIVREAQGLQGDPLTVCLADRTKFWKERDDARAIIKDLCAALGTSYDESNFTATAFNAKSKALTLQNTITNLTTSNNQSSSLLAKIKALFN